MASSPGVKTSRPSMSLRRSCPATSGGSLEESPPVTKARAKSLLGASPVEGAHRVHGLEGLELRGHLLTLPFPLRERRDQRRQLPTLGDGLG
jgi:hypothetical protein